MLFISTLLFILALVFIKTQIDFDDHVFVRSCKAIIALAMVSLALIFLINSNIIINYHCQKYVNNEYTKVETIHIINSDTIRIVKYQY